MIIGIVKLWQSGFIRSVATVASGAALAQFVTMAFAPVITRLYGPEAFGLQSLFLSLLGMCGTLAALAYPAAIVMPRKQRDALTIVKLALIIGTLVAALLALVLYLVAEELLQLIGAESLGHLVYLLPLALILSLLSSLMDQWLIRNKAYRILAWFKVTTALITGVTKSGVGVIVPGASTLILTNMVCGLAGTFLALALWLRKRSTEFTGVLHFQIKSMVAVARDYRDFPLYRAPQNFINTASQSLPIILISAYFGPVYAGQYAIAISVLGVPTSLIANSVMAVFYPRVTDAVRNNENARKLILKSMLAMALFGSAPYFFLAVSAPAIFPYIFGEEWVMSGQYAQWLAPWLFLQYLNRPAVAAVPVLGLQKGLLLYEVFSTGSKLVALWVGYVLYRDAIISVAIYSIVGSLAYIFLIFWVLYESGATPMKAIHSSGQNEL